MEKWKWPGYKGRDCETSIETDCVSGVEYTHRNDSHNIPNNYNVPFIGEHILDSGYFASLFIMSQIELVFGKPDLHICPQ
jgi:hypothetical protein